MKIIKSLTLVLLASIVTTLVSCKKDDDGDDTQTPKEILLADLDGTWNLDAANSQLANISDIDANSVSATFGETGFTLTGEITDFVEETGTYSISDEGAFSNVVVAISGTDLELSGTPNLTINSANDQITISFSTTEASGRVSGLGDYILVFVKAS